MDRMKPSLHGSLTPLSRRLAAGLFLEIWPPWAIGTLLVGGVTVLACRLFVPAAAPFLRWFWLGPLAAALPALFLCWRRRYRESELVGIADWLGGGRGLLLAVYERGDAAWAASPSVHASLALALPRLKLRRVAGVLPALAFLAVTLWLP